MKPAQADVLRSLSQWFEAERNVRLLHGELAKVPAPVLIDALGAAVEEALTLDDGDEAALRLVRLSSLLGELEGPRTVDLLIDILGSEEPEARHAAGEALEELAFDRFKEVALGTERALGRLPPGNPALLELPYLLSGIGEPGVRKLLGRFLLNEDPDAVSAAIEAIVEMGDGDAAPLLESLVSDAREVSLEDDEGEEGTVTIGELAREAITLLTEIAEPARGGGAEDNSRALDPNGTRTKGKRH
jgi:HEAT repeat protein